MITLIVGSTGAGKTTYARKVAKEMSAVVYSIDNWMQELYGLDMPHDPAPQWFYDNQKWYTERIALCENLIKKISLNRAKLSQKSLLDLGFTTKTHRLNFIQYFQSQNIEVQIHFIVAPSETRKKRVESRNQLKGETFVMTVDDTLFEFMENIFEPPTLAEGAELIVIKN